MLTESSDSGLCFSFLEEHLTPHNEHTFKRWIGTKRKGWHQVDVRSSPEGLEYAKTFASQRMDSDLYWTPAEFKNLTLSRRNKSQVFHVPYLWVDIDGVPGTRNPGQAWGKLADTCDSLDIPQPNMVFCTGHCSTETLLPEYVKLLEDDVPHLQALWCTAAWGRGGLQLWQWAADCIARALSRTGLKVDRSASTNIQGLLRLPGTINTKTHTTVRRVGPLTDKEYPLWDLYAAARSAEKKMRQPKRAWHTVPAFSPDGRRKLLDLPHMQTLAQGVTEGMRNAALYALTKALWADGYSPDEAVNWAIEWNERCQPPESRSKVESTVRCIYEADPAEFKGISPSVVADMVGLITGDNVKPDPNISKLFPRHYQLPAQEPSRRPPGRPKKDGKKAWENYAEQIIQAGIVSHGCTITNSRMAAVAGCSEETIRKRAKLIRRNMQAETGLTLIRARHGYRAVDESLIEPFPLY